MNFRYTKKIVSRLPIHFIDEPKPQLNIGTMRLTQQWKCFLKAILASKEFIDTNIKRWKENFLVSNEEESK